MQLRINHRRGRGGRWLSALISLTVVGAALLSPLLASADPAGRVIHHSATSQYTGRGTYGDGSTDPGYPGCDPNPYVWVGSDQCERYDAAAGGWQWMQWTQTSAAWDETLSPATVSGTLTCTAGTNGWCRSTATLAITGHEPVAGYGVTSIGGTRDGVAFSCSGASCARGPVGDTAGTTFVYRAYSSFGDSSYAGTTTFKVDTSAPTVTPALVGPVGANGWYHGPVQVTLAASDATSGVSALELNGSPYAPLVVSTEGVAPFTYRGQDLAGNWSALQNGTVKIDTLPPATTASLAGTLGLNGWYTTPAQVTLNSVDAMSGVGLVNLDGVAYGGPRSYGDGTFTSAYFAADWAGNVEIAKSLSFNVDTTAPTVTPQIAGTAGANGWYRSPVQVTLSGTDPTSGLQALELNGSPYAPQAVNAEGPTPFSYRGQDQAGNWSALQSAVVKVDTVAPDTTAAITGTPGLNGWYVSPAQVTLSSADATSEVASTDLDGTTYTGPRTYGDGQYALAYNSTDMAGNPEAAQTLALKVDGTPPSVLAQVAGTIGLAGWYVSPVTITLSGNDATSGLVGLELSGETYLAPVIITAQGPTNYAYRGQDQAGNWSASQSDRFKIDSATPQTTATLSGTLGLHSIYVTPVSVTLTSQDATSGVAGVTLDGVSYTVPQVYTDGVHTLTYGATDIAGNEEPLHRITFSVDTQTPHTTVSISGPKKDSGWYTGDVTVRFTTDSDAQVYVDGQPYVGALTFTSNGGHSLQYHAVDRAGNTEAERTVSFNIDRDAPETSGAATIDANGTISLDLYLSDAVSGVRDGGIYVMSADWQVLKVFPLSAERAHFDWDGRLDSGKLPPPGYFLIFYARDQAGNEVYRSVDTPTVVAVVVSPSAAPLSTRVVTRTLTRTVSTTPTATRKATPGEIAAPTGTPALEATAAPSPTPSLPPPPRATYPPLATPVSAAPVTARVVPPPADLRLNLWLVALSLFCLGAMLLAASLAAVRDPRPPAVQSLAQILDHQLRFTLEE